MFVQAILEQDGAIAATHSCFSPSIKKPLPKLEEATE
jgi:hypothetical protein